MCLCPNASKNVLITWVKIVHYTHTHTSRLLNLKLLAHDFWSAFKRLQAPLPSWEKFWYSFAILTRPTLGSKYAKNVPTWVSHYSTQSHTVWVSYIKRSVCTLAAVCSAHSPVLAHHMPERCGCTVIMHNSCRVIFQFKGHYQLQKEISKLSDYICQASLVFVPLARQKIVELIK